MKQEFTAVNRHERSSRSQEETWYQVIRTLWSAVLQRRGHHIFTNTTYCKTFLRFIYFTSFVAPLHLVRPDGCAQEEQWVVQWLRLHVEFSLHESGKVLWVVSRLEKWLIHLPKCKRLLVLLSLRLSAPFAAWWASETDDPCTPSQYQHRQNKIQCDAIRSTWNAVKYQDVWLV